MEPGRQTAYGAFWAKKSASSDSRFEQFLNIERIVKLVGQNVFLTLQHNCEVQANNYKKALLSQRRPRDAPNIWVP